MIVSRRRAWRSSMWSAYAGNLRPTGVGVVGEVVELNGGRHQRDATLGHGVDQVGGQAGAVLDAVDAGLDQHGKHRLAEAVGGDPGAVLVSGRRSRRRTPRRGRTAPGRPSHGRSSRRRASPSRRPPRPRARRRPSGRPARPRGRSHGCSGGSGPGGGRSGSGAGGRRGRAPSGCRPESRSRAAAGRRRRGRRRPAPRDVASSTAPWASRPRWQWASTSPGTIQPSAAVSAPACCSRVIRPSTT